MYLPGAPLHFPDFLKYICSMNTYIASEEVLSLYAQAAARLSLLERLAAAAFTTPSASTQSRRDARITLDEAAKAIRAFYDTFSFTGDTARDTLGLGTEADRKQKIFLADYLSRLAASTALLEKRLDQTGAQNAKAFEALEPSAIEAKIKASQGEGSADFQQAAGVFLAAFDFFRNLAQRMPQEAAKAQTKKANALDKELLSIKIRSFVDLTASAGAVNPELLFKAKTKFERLEQEGVPRSVLAEPPSGTVGITKTDGGMELGYEEKGVSLMMRFRVGASGRYEGSVSGFVESGGERAEYSLRDPQAKDGKIQGNVDAGTLFAQFLNRFDLRRLYESSAASFQQLEEDEKLKPARTADKLSKALDDIL